MYKREIIMRINKRLVELGYCSRRQADKLIERGQVLINGNIATLGQDVSDTDKIEVSGKQLINSVKDKIILAYNKEKGIICTESKVEKQSKISDKIKEFGIDGRLFTVGRLDKDTTGLLIITNDGALAKYLTDAKNKVEKEYEVKVNKDINNDFIKKAEKGVYIEELDKTTGKAKIKKIGNDKRSFSITITEGFNREIKRLCLALGYRVVELKRIRIKKLTLSDLPLGQYKYITKKDIGL